MSIRSFLESATLVFAVAVAAECGTAHAQVYGLIGSPGTTLGDWTVVPGNPTYPGGADYRAIADVNADGRDDIVWLQANTSNLTAMRVFTSANNGIFNTHFRSDVGTSVNGNLPTTTSNIDIFSPISVSAGNYVGGGGDEVLLCVGTDTSPAYWLLDWFAPGKPIVLATRTNTIGAAQIKTYVNGQYYSTKIITGNFAGLNDREILTLEREPTGTRAQIQHFSSPGFNDFVSIWTNNGNNTLGEWNFNLDQDEFYVADFIVSNNSASNVKDEILCVNKTNGWLRIVAYNEVTHQWYTVFQNGGSRRFLPGPPIGQMASFDTTTRFLVGNFDTDAHVELVIYYWNRSLPAMQAYEFNRTTAAFTSRSVTATLTRLFGNYSSTDQTLTILERWSTPRVCKRRAFGLCVEWTGGQSFITQHVVNSSRVQIGETKFLVGRFGANAQPATTAQLLALYDSGSSLPSMPAFGVFVTSCKTSSMTSGACGNSVALYNLAGQLINYYYPGTNTFRYNSWLPPNPTLKQMLVPAGNF